MIILAAWLQGAYAATVSGQMEHQRDNLGLDRTALVADWSSGREDVSWGASGIRLSWVQTRLLDSLNSIPPLSTESAGLVLHWTRRVSSVRMFLLAGFDALRSDGWTLQSEITWKLARHLQTSLQGGSELLDGSLLARDVRSSHAGASIQCNLEESGFWSEAGASRDLRSGGRNPESRIQVVLPNNQIDKQYVWVAQSFAHIFAAGLSISHSTSSHNLTQTTDTLLSFDSNGNAVMTYFDTDYPYSAPAEEWSLAVILSMDKKWEPSQGHWLGTSLKFIAPAWSNTKKAWDVVNASGSHIHGYYWQDGVASARAEFEVMYADMSGWTLKVPCALESTPAEPQGYFGKGAWNSLELGVAVERQL